MSSRRFDLRYLLIFALAFIVIISTGTVNATTYDCVNCSNCTNAIGNASAGDIVQLNQSISNYTGGTCIDFNGTDNIIFDCLSYSNFIDGDDVNDAYGIFSGSTAADNITIRNCNITDFDYGIFASGINITIFNITSQSSDYGIGTGTFQNSIINQSTVNNNDHSGVSISNYAYGNTFVNITAQENAFADFSFSTASDDNCNNNFTNIIGSGGRPIEFYNYSETIQDKELSILILCNADNSTIDNVTIRGSDTIKNNFLLLQHTENVVITDVNSSNNYDGIRLISSDNITITGAVTPNNTVSGIFLQYTPNSVLSNITSNFNSGTGIWIYSTSHNTTLTNITANYNTMGIKFEGSTNNTLINFTANYNTNGLQIRSSNHKVMNGILSHNSNSGLYLIQGASDNNITNITSNSNTNYGVYVVINSDNNIINNSHIENNTHGIYFSHSGSDYPQYNTIYNNFFNNTANYYNSTNLTNYFNTTKTNTSGTNIIGESYIGGNYWAYPNGTGFSDTCADSNDDGICDSSYNVDGVSQSYDYFPLAGEGCTESWTCTAWSVCSGGTQTRTCTDSNSCGTTVDKPAVSQTCTVGEPGGGGGVTKDQPTESHTWTEITPDQPAEMIIDDPEIDLTKITISTTTTVSGASVQVTKIKVVPLSDLRIGMAGDTYQSFKIETTGLTDENIETVTIEFKVNKTWVDEQGGTAEDIMLYRGGEKVNVWDELDTTLTGSDSDYYYFSAISTGFSIFVVVIDLSACNNNGVCETELGEDEANCPKDCGAEKKGFFETIKSYLWTSIILVLVIAIVLVVLFIRLKKGKQNKRLKQIMSKNK